MGIGKNLMACAAVLAALCTMLPAAAHAQPDRQSVSLLYGATFPAGNGFTDRTGFADLSVEYSVRLTPVLAAGFSLGYGYVRQKGYTNDRYDGDLVSGFSDRSLSAIPILVQLRCFPWKQQARLQPYIIIGAGMQYAGFDIVGDQIDRRRAGDWSIAFSPQVGTRFFPAAGKRFYLDARVSWRYAGNRWEIMDVKSIRRTGVALGTGIMF